MIEIVRITLDNIHELSEKTGRAPESLLEQYFNEKPAPAYVTLGLPKKEN